MSLATLNGAAIARATVQVPAWGLWFADVDLTDEIELAGRVTLVIGDVTASGTIVSGGAIHGKAAYRVVGGAGGWGKTVPRAGYSNDAGVRILNVLADAALACGETLAGALTTALGPHFARAEGPAYRTLNALAPQAWYLGFDGVTRFGARPVTAYAGAGARTRVSPAPGVVEIATEEIAALIPGVTIDESLPASDVEYSLTAKRLTVKVYTGRKRSRRLQAFALLLDALDPSRIYRAAYEFRVIAQTGERLHLQPARVAIGMPELTNVPVRPGMAGLKAQVAPGSLVVVQFLDGDPSRPCVTNHDAPDAPGWMPIELDLGGPGALGVARLTDAVQAGPFAGVITFASTRIKAAL